MSIYGRCFWVIACGTQLCGKEQLFLVFDVYYSSKTSADKELHTNSLRTIPEILLNSNINYSILKLGKLDLGHLGLSLR